MCEFSTHQTWQQMESFHALRSEAYSPVAQTELRVLRHRGLGMMGKGKGRALPDFAIWKWDKIKWWDNIKWWQLSENPLQWSLQFPGWDIHAHRVCSSPWGWSAPTWQELGSWFHWWRTHPSVLVPVKERKISLSTIRLHSVFFFS